MNSFGQRLGQTLNDYGQLCVGIDPSVKLLSDWGLTPDAKGAKEFGRILLEEARGISGLTKFQVSFFEQFGPEGFSTLQFLLDLASKNGFLVIADAKRGDIDSSMQGYANAWLSDRAPFEIDALTVSPYLGPESLEDVVDTAISNHKGLFILCATSNVEGTRLQGSVSQGVSVAGQVMEFAERYKRGGLGEVGLVIGAGLGTSWIVDAEKHLDGIPILSPGFGVQGTQLADLRANFGKISKQVIATMSRSIAGESRLGIRDRIIEFKNQLSNENE